MESMKRGDKGQDVLALQAKLKSLGYDVGTPDGDYGKKTFDAVLAYQKSKGLAADGAAGQGTLTSLGLAAPFAPPDQSYAARFTVDHACKMFPNTKRKNIEANLPFVLKAMIAANLGDRDMVLTALSNVRAETEQFLPVKEGVSRYNTSPGGKPFDLYDGRADLGNRGNGTDGEDFAGAGYVQLTGLDNFLKIGQAIGLGDALVKNPKLACEPEIAGKILAAFIKRVEHKCRAAIAANDIAKNRKLVNGGSHGLDRFSDAWRIGRALAV